MPDPCGGRVMTSPLHRARLIAKDSARPVSISLPREEVRVPGGPRASLCLRHWRGSTLTEQGLPYKKKATYLTSRLASRGKPAALRTEAFLPSPLRAVTAEPRAEGAGG